MALQFAGGAPIARLADASNLPAGSCAWIDWDSRLGGPPGEVYVDVNAAGRPAPNPESIRTALADAKRFYLFPTRFVGGEPLASYRGEWIPRASSQATGHATQRTTDAGIKPIIRQLMRRGGPSGFEFKVIANPSPAHPESPRYVRLAIRYRAYLASDTAELALASMTPGSCGWDMRFGAPEPPGEVIIDIKIDAQASNAGLGIPRDTSARAALAYPDTGSFSKYLSESSRFWTFFHLDRGEPLATSHGAYKPDLTNLLIGSVREAQTTASGTRTTGATPSGVSAVPPAAPAPAPVPPPSDSGSLRRGIAARNTTSDAATILRMAELRCRGGSGLAFAPRGSAGDNQVVVTLSYPVSPAVPGATGRGLAPGSCAWVDRTGLAREPGSVVFITAGNAQLRQTQSGSAVDRSPTAAERWPDAHTIPVYLSDPSRFWRFTVVMVDSDSARQHGPWKPSLTDALAGPVTEASSTRAVRQAPVTVSRTPSVAESAAVTQRDGASSTSAVSGAQRVPTDTTSRRLATTRTSSGARSVAGNDASAIPAPAPSPPPAGGVAGSLRGESPSAAPVGRTLPTDTAARRSAIERTPTPKQSAEVHTSIPQMRATRVYNVRTAPGPRGVMITFDATGVSAKDREVLGGFLLPGDPLSSIRVHFSLARPTWSERERTWSFPAGSNSVWDARISQREGGGYEAVPSYDLGAGNRYYYLITVYSSDESSPPVQRTGSFTADVRTPLNGLFSN
jgi:hypothetical protein